jgi:solute carrier family 35 protein F1/2
MAYKNTSVLSALIIASWNLPCTMLLSALFLYARYKPVHFAAVSLCLAGVACSIWSDTMGTDSAANHTWVGDLLCVRSILPSPESNHAFLTFFVPYSLSVRPFMV